MIGFVVLMIGLFGFALIDSAVTGNVVSNEKIVINFPRSADFLNTEHAGVVFEFSFPADSFRVNNRTADLLLLLESEVVNGLKVGYDVNSRKLVGGLPLLYSTEVSLIDGKSHKIIYNFSKKEGKQYIYLDGVLVASGEYTGESVEDLLTGYAVRKQIQYIDSQVPIIISSE